jgi:hypothetical protein
MPTLCLPRPILYHNSFHTESVQRNSYLVLDIGCQRPLTQLAREFQTLDHHIVAMDNLPGKSHRSETPSIPTLLTKSPHRIPTIPPPTPYYPTTHVFPYRLQPRAPPRDIPRPLRRPHQRVLPRSIARTPTPHIPRPIHRAARRAPPRLNA